MKLIRFCFASIILLLVLSACSYLEDYFPDKEKDYQYTSEIPLLNWPAELRRNQSVTSAESAPVNEAPAASSPDNGTAISDSSSSEIRPSHSGELAPQAEAASAPVAPVEIKTSEEDDRHTISSVEIIKYDDGESRLRLGTGLSKAWRAVSKAITHNSIEVTERNHDQGQITVQYDPDAKKAKDDSFLDELSFFFKGIDSHEQEYRLKLEEHNGNTDLLVLNQEHLPMLNSESALRLLKAIADTIKTDQAEKKAEEKPAE